MCYWRMMTSSDLYLYSLNIKLDGIANNLFYTKTLAIIVIIVYRFIILTLFTVNRDALVYRVSYYHHSTIITMVPQALGPVNFCLHNIVHHSFSSWPVINLNLPQFFLSWFLISFLVFVLSICITVSSLGPPQPLYSGNSLYSIITYNWISPKSIITIIQKIFLPKILTLSLNLVVSSYVLKLKAKNIVYNSAYI